MKRIFKNIVMSFLALALLSTSCVMAAESAALNADEAIPGYCGIGIKLPVDFP